jgi:hypothetical protein
MYQDCSSSFHFFKSIFFQNLTEKIAKLIEFTIKKKWQSFYIFCQKIAKFRQEKKTLLCMFLFLIAFTLCFMIGKAHGRDIHKMQGWTRLSPHLLAPYHTSALPYTYIIGPAMANT